MSRCKSSVAAFVWFLGGCASSSTGVSGLAGSGVSADEASTTSASGAQPGQTGGVNSTPSDATTVEEPSATVGKPTGSGASTGSNSSGATSTADSGAPDALPMTEELAVIGPTYDSGVTDPGTTGDGDRTIGPNYAPAPETMTMAGASHGKIIYFSFQAGESAIYPGAPLRQVAVYVPAQYVTGTPAPVMVVQDGLNFYGWIPTLTTTLDNLIAAKKVPPIVAVLPSNGGGDSVGSERGLEYDTVSGLYAEWADSELLPRAELETKKQIPNQAVTFTHDPQGRAALGGSSGGAASFSMAWWHPDLFNRVIAFSGTFVNQVPATSPFPHGCWVYHDVDPYDAAAPNGLIVQHCENASGSIASSNPGPCDTPLSQMACAATTNCSWNTVVNRPIRIWHESGTMDLGAGGAPSTYRNFDLANQRMAASFSLRGYHYHYDHALGATHVDQRVLQQTLPEALVWLWRGYP